MRSQLLSLALLPLFLLALALPAHADTDNFIVIGGGQTFDFSLPASMTQPCCSYTGDFNFGLVAGTVNGVNQSIGVSFITGSGCAVCGTIVLSYPSTYWTIYLPSLYEITFSEFPPDQDETLTFIPGDYMTEGYTPVNRSAFDITVASDAAATPEPATIVSLITAALGLPLVCWRRRALTS